MFLTEFMSNVLANYMGALSVVLPHFNFLADAGLDQPTALKDGLRYVGGGAASAGFIGAGVGQGNAGAGACMAIGRNPEVASKITTTMIISAGIAESGAIYALVVAILILFVV